MNCFRTFHCNFTKCKGKMIIKICDKCIVEKSKMVTTVFCPCIEKSNEMFIVYKVKDK